MKKKGFTIIELLVVIATISILTAIIVPKILKEVRRSIVAKVQHNLGVIRFQLSLDNSLAEEFPDLVNGDTNLLNSYNIKPIPGFTDSNGISYPEKSKVVDERDNKGGWFYDRVQGKIYANLPNGAYTKDEEYELWEEEISEIGQENSFTSESYFSTKEGKPYQIISYNGNAGTDLNIPNEKDGVIITEIGHAAFYKSENTWDELTSVKLPDTLMYIGSLAFRGNSLESIYIPSEVSTIGILSFADNNLSNITIEEGVTKIGNSAFFNNNISNITIPNSVSQIDEYAFASNDIREITIGNEVVIGKRSFYNNNTNSFKTFYDDNGQEAGTYVYENGSWLKK